MTQEEIQIELKNIETMSHEDMAYLWRFAPVGHVYFFSDSLLWEAFEKRWKEFGGMTPEISKRIGLIK